MSTGTLWFGRIARALGHNGALSEEEAASCSSIRAANALMKAHGINYNDSLPRDRKWMSGKEGWEEIFAQDGGGIIHTTATGRLTVTIRQEDSFLLTFESAEMNDFGSHLVAKLFVRGPVGDENGPFVFPEVVSNLLEGRPDRIGLLKKIDTTGELISGLRRLAGRPGYSGSVDAKKIIDAIDALSLVEQEVTLEMI